MCNRIAANQCDGVFTGWCGSSRPGQLHTVRMPPPAEARPVPQAQAVEAAEQQVAVQARKQLPGFQMLGSNGTARALRGKTVGRRVQSSRQGRVPVVRHPVQQSPAAAERSSSFGSPRQGHVTAARRPMQQSLAAAERSSSPDSPRQGHVAHARSIILQDHAAAARSSSPLSSGSSPLPVRARCPPAALDRPRSEAWHGGTSGGSQRAERPVQPTSSGLDGAKQNEAFDCRVSNRAVQEGNTARDKSPSSGQAHGRFTSVRSVMKRVPGRPPHPMPANKRFKAPRRMPPEAATDKQ